MNNEQNFDEVTFALFYDDEMSQEESQQFETALESDTELLARYERWIYVQEGISAHFESLEANYSLDGFTNRIMDALPEQAPWEVEAPRRAPVEEPQTDSWIKRILFPLMIGSLTTAVILVIMRQSTPSDQVPQNSVSPSNQDNTTLIKDSEVKVTWLEEDDEDEEDSDEDDGI